MKGGGCLRRLLKEKRGEGFVDVCVLVLSVALVLALVVRIAPVFVAKQNLDVFADELVRTAEINGQVGSVTSSKGRTASPSCSARRATASRSRPSPRATARCASR